MRYWQIISAFTLAQFSCREGCKIVVGSKKLCIFCSRPSLRQRLNSSFRGSRGNASQCCESTDQCFSIASFLTARSLNNSPRGAGFQPVIFYALESQPRTGNISFGNRVLAAQTAAFIPKSEASHRKQCLTEQHWSCPNWLRCDNSNCPSTLVLKSRIVRLDLVTGRCWRRSADCSMG